MALIKTAAQANIAGNYDRQNGAGAYGALTDADAAKVPAIPNTPAVVSSKDVAAGFTNNSNMLNSKIPPPTQTPTVDPNAPVTPPPVAIDSAANKGTGSGASANTGGGTGDPIYDSLEIWKTKRQLESATIAQENRAQYDTLFKTSLGALDKTYAATVQNINVTYDGRLAEQKRINDLNINRTRAYGLATDNALAAPIEFTNAVSEREQEASNKIKTLDNERNALIAEAMAARDTGASDVLQAKIDNIQKVEKDMRDSISEVAREANEQYQLLVGIRKDQEAKQLKQSQQMLANATVKYGEDYVKAKDNVAKDAVIKKIIADSGGLLDYATVLTTFAAKMTADEEKAMDKQKSELDMAYKRAQIKGEEASTALTWKNYNKKDEEKVTPESSYSTINTLLGMKMPDGTRYTDDNGFFTPKGFNALVSAAAEDKISREQFIKQYGNKIYVGDDPDNPVISSDYRLTPAEKKALTGL